MGRKRARKNFIEQQYFEDFYKRHASGTDARITKVHYIEMLPEQAEIITAGQLIQDYQNDLLNMFIAQNMLDNAEAMHEDILGPYAPAILKEQKTGSCPYLS